LGALLNREWAELLDDQVMRVSFAPVEEPSCDS